MPSEIGSSEIGSSEIGSSEIGSPEIGVTDWLELSHDRISRFNSVIGGPTTDRVSPFLLVSLLPGMLAPIPLSLPAARATINYGLDKVQVVRLPQPGSRIRARVVLGAVEEVGTALQVKRLITIEGDGEERLLIVETLTRLVY